MCTRFATVINAFKLRTVVDGWFVAWWFDVSEERATMTVAKARVIFATHMQAARKRKLTAYESNQLSTARQVLRTARKPATNKPQRNPKRVLIYGNVQTIYAQKTQSHICDAECKKHNHRYFHDFHSKPKMYGLPNGDLLITTR